MQSKDRMVLTQQQEEWSRVMHDETRSISERLDASEYLAESCGDFGDTAFEGLSHSTLRKSPILRASRAEDGLQLCRCLTVCLGTRLEKQIGTKSRRDYGMSGIALLMP